MRPLALEFEAGARRNRAGLALLVAGVAAVAACGYHLLDLQQQTAAWEARAADLRRLAERRMGRLDENLPANAGLAVEVRGANRILSQMTVPWDELFRELEAASDESVALLSIQPDADGRQLRIAGEARNVAALLEYVAKLERNQTLARVMLTGHEIRQSGSQRPLGFSLTADWVTRS